MTRFSALPIVATLLLFDPLTAALHASQSHARSMSVSRLVDGNVEIDVPDPQDLWVGARLVVERDGFKLADLEVTGIGAGSATCRIERLTSSIAGGDLVRIVARQTSPRAPQSTTSPDRAASPPAASSRTTVVQATASPPVPERGPESAPSTANSQPEGPTMTVLRAEPRRVEITLLDEQPVRVGDRLTVERGGSVIGEIEVVLVGEHSASCRIDRELQPMTQGDVVRPLLVHPSPAHSPAGTETNDQIRVRQVLTGEVFLNAGRSKGLVAGQKVTVVRNDAEIAELEIAFIANHSASCRILSATEAIEIGDRIIPGPVPEAPSPAARSASTGTGSRTTTTSGPRSGGRPVDWKPAEHTDYSGSIALRYHGFRDGSESGRDFDETSALFNIYLGHVAGGEFDVRLRGTTSREQIHSDSRPSESRNNDRLYEATLIYEPPDARLTFQFGRLISGPLVGFDYLDGLAAELHATSRFGLGAFYGTRLNSDQLTFATGGRAYGVFAHWLDQEIGRPFYAEYLFEVIGDYVEGQTNREYISLYGRQGSGSRWSLYERAELDLNRSWRSENGNSDYQLSNVLLSGSYSFSKIVRLGLTYDQSRLIRTLDDRFTPEELFDNALREGVRLTAYLGSAKTLRGNISVGQRWKQGEPERSRTYSANVYHSNVFHLNLLAGVDYSGFTGESSNGYRTGLRIQKYFRQGHDLELAIGSSTTEINATGEQRKNEWVRLDGTLQLGRRFYLLGEYEKGIGDDLEGDRLFVQLGYRL